MTESTTTELVQLASGDRTVAKQLALAERDRLAAAQRVATDDAAADRELRVAEARLRLTEERGEVKARRAERRQAQRETKREAKRTRKAARRQTIAARVNGWIDYARNNAAAVYSSLIYGLAVSGAVYGQVDAARANGLPTPVGVIAAAAIEGTGLAMALTAQHQRMAGERAVAARSLIWIATAAAVAINAIGHHSDPIKAVGLSALSALGIVVYEVRSGAKHRPALRAKGMIPEPPERFGWRRWVAAPGETWDAWRLDARTRVGAGAAALIARAAAMRTERAEAAEREAARAEVMRLARKAVRKVSRKGDNAGPALAALVYLASTGTPAPQQALSAKPEPVDDDVRRLCDEVLRQASGARARLFGSAPGIAARRPYAPTRLALAPPAHEPVRQLNQSTRREPTQPAVNESADESTRRHRREPARTRRTTAARAGKGSRVTVADRAGSGEAGLPAAYEALTKDLGREPSGQELADRVGVSKATANRWKVRRNEQSA